jgi:hypothetical protein
MSFTRIPSWLFSPVFIPEVRGVQKAALLKSECGLSENVSKIYA